MDELDLVELVHANDAAIVTTRAACFAAEARSMGGHFDGELAFGEEGVAVEIGDRNLGGWREEKLVVFRAIHVVLELGELAGSLHAFALDDVGNVDLFIAVFTTLKIEEELDEGTLEPGSLASIDRKAGSREARTIVEADEAFFFSEIEVIAGIGERWLFSPAADNGVGFLVSTNRTIFVWKIRDVKKKFVLALGGLTSFVVESLDLFADLLDFGFDARGIFAIGAEFSNFLGGCFALGLQDLLGRFVFAAGLVASEDFVDKIGGAIVTIGEAFFDEFRIFADDFDVEHGERLDVS